MVIIAGPYLALWLTATEDCGFEPEFARKVIADLDDEEITALREYVLQPAKFKIAFRQAIHGQKIRV